MRDACWAPIILLPGLSPKAGWLISSPMLTISNQGVLASAAILQPLGFCLLLSFLQERGNTLKWKLHLKKTPQHRLAFCTGLY